MFLFLLFFLKEGGGGIEALMMRRATSFFSNLFIFGTLGLPGSILYVPYVLIMELVVPGFLSIIGEKSPRLIKKKKKRRRKFT